MKNAPLLPPLLMLFLLAVGCRPPFVPSEPKLASSLPAVLTANASSDAEPSFSDLDMRAMTGRVSVIMYHDVIAKRGKDSVWFDVTRDEFQKHIDYIVENGFTVISLDQLYRHLTRGEEVPERAVVLTFDDNYLGVYENALPLLRQYKMPAAVFVHTAYVGSTQGHPKMSWDQLRDLQKEGLVTIGAHTVTHPENFKLLSAEIQRKELVDSKASLERELGVEIPYMAYPLGSNDGTTQLLAREAGYKMSFTMDPTPAEASPNILCVGRYEAKKFVSALDEQKSALRLPIVRLELKRAPIDAFVDSYAGLKLAVVKGGSPMTVQAQGRKGVGQFVEENGGFAGINGTFFSAAAIRSDDNKLIGPCKPANVATFMPDPETYRLPKLRDRPMVMWSEHSVAVVPFTDAMNSEDIFKKFMPDYTDAFLTGGWLVVNGAALSKEQIAAHASKDAMDYRKRAFFGFTRDGEVICGASTGSVRSDQLASAAAAAGADVAVLLDSGFSTSLVYDGLILASGHSNAEHPSRPVPHAIVLKGEKGTAEFGTLKPIPVHMVPVVEEGSSAPRKKRKRR